MKVALVYDRVNKWGGAERVLLALHKLFPDAPLYTSVYHPKKAPWADVFTIKTSFLQHIPFAASAHELFASFMPIAFESFDFDEYDLVISVTSEAAKGIITKPKTKHVCLCLTPTRYLWSGYNDYFIDPIFKLLSKPIVWYLRWWDRIAAKRPDAYVAISKTVKNRIKKYYDEDATVIYPPVELGKNGKALPLTLSISPYFLVVSRLVPYKRIDIAIEACNTFSYPLIIVGEGSEEKRLRKLAGPTITFVKNLTDGELVEYYKNCRALIFPGEEDLGLTAIEAQSFGKPVIAYRKGGVLETVIDGKTGAFFYPQSAVSLQKVLTRFKEKRFKRSDCQKNAKKFTFDVFKRDFLPVLKKLSI